MGGPLPLCEASCEWQAELVPIAAADQRRHMLEDRRIQAALRDTFRGLNRFMVILWRLGFGPMFGWFPSTAGRILVLHHVGRRTGRLFQSPVNFAIVDDTWFCVAAFGNRTDWYRNLMQRPRVEVWAPDGRWTVDVEDVSDRADRTDLIREVLLASGFAAPAFGIDPRSLTDAELEAASADYRLLALHRAERLEGSAADLAWTWVAAVGAALLFRGRSR